MDLRITKIFFPTSPSDSLCPSYNHHWQKLIQFLPHLNYLLPKPHSDPKSTALTVEPILTNPSRFQKFPNFKILSFDMFYEPINQIDID